ncbi:MAG: bifunctional riboflavin kinase/FAD synthetase [Burkholderiaceae bacterium]
MEVLRTLPDVTERQPCGLTIGNFDGVHLGHQAMLARLRRHCDQAGLPMAVLTFEPHPREYFARLHGREAPARISVEADKLAALAHAGVNRVCVLPFDRQLAETEAATFVQRILIDGLAVRELLIGDDFRFGARRAGDFALLSQLAEGRFQLSRMPTIDDGDGHRVSSSLVRDALARGDFGRVRELLGRPYEISGPVAHGRKLGRTLGFPTLNIRFGDAKPALAGIFVVQVHGLGERPWPAVASLGTRPAVEADGEPLLEVHLFDFSREIYGMPVRVEFLQKLRDERGFDSLEALRQQIDADAAQARAYFASPQDSDGQA